MLIWAAVLLVGVNHTLAADETLDGDLVRAAVATTVTSELDDMAVFLYRKEAKLVEVTYFRYGKPADGPSTSFF